MINVCTNMMPSGTFLLSHREASGLCLFPADLGPTCSSMPAQQDTVDVGMTAVWTTIHVSTHIHTVILTYSVLVTGKVQQFEHISLSLNNCILYTH